MAELKTRPSDADIKSFIKAVEPPTRRQDAGVVCRMMEQITRRQVDQRVLARRVRKSVAHLRKTWPST